MVSPRDMASEITSEDLGRICRRYSIPSDVLLRLPEAEQRVSQGPENGVFIYEESLKAGLRFPFHPLVKEIMRFYNICPTMVAPNSWRSIIGFISMCHQAKVTATLPLFRTCFHLLSGGRSEWSYIGPRKSFRAITDKPSSIKEWKVRFFLAEGNIGSDFPMGWGSFARDAETHITLSEQEEEDLGVLSDGRVFSATSLLSEEALFAAGLSPVDPQVRRSALAGRIEGELGKRPREAGERRRLEKKARLSRGSPSRAERAEVGLHSPPSKKEVVEASVVREESLQLVVAAVDEQRVEEDPGETAEIPCPLVVEIDDSSDEAPMTRSTIIPSGEEIPLGSAEVDTSAVLPPSEEMPLAPVTETEGAMVVAGVQEEPSVQEFPSEGSRDDAGPSMAADELPPPAVGEAERVQASSEPVVEDRAPDAEGEPSDGEEEQGGSPSVEALRRLAPGLAELSEESQARVLLKEARRLKASRLDAAQAGPSGAQPADSDPAIEAAFSVLMKSALCPGAGSSMDELADLDLVHAAFGRRDVAKDIHLLPDIDNSSLMGMARSYASRSALITRALCWCLRLATGAGIQAKRVSAELRLRAGASDRFERVLDTANSNLEQAQLLHQEALQEIDRLNLEVEELRGLRARCDEVCSELLKVKSGHTEEMEALRKRFGESWNKLRGDAAEERSRLTRMLGEGEEKIRRLQQDIVARDDRIRWDQEKIKLLTGELSQSREETSNKQLRINDLKDRVDQAKADKLRAFGDVERLTEATIRLEKEV